MGGWGRTALGEPQLETQPPWVSHVPEPKNTQGNVVVFLVYCSYLHFLPVIVDTQTLQGVKRSQKIRWIAHLTETRLTIFHDFVLKFWVLNWLFCMCHRGQSLLSCGGWVASGRPCPSSEVVGAVGVQTLGRGAMHRFSLWLLSNLKSNEDRSVSMSISVPVGGVRLTSAEF